MKVTYKRYQYYSSKGLVWTEWFTYNSNYTPKYQIDKKLLNEYK